MVHGGRLYPMTPRSDPLEIPAKSVPIGERGPDVPEPVPCLDTLSVNSVTAPRGVLEPPVAASEPVVHHVVEDGTELEGEPG